MTSFKSRIAQCVLAVTMACLFPLLWFVRLILQPVLSRHRISVWTGAPIITLSRKCRAERMIGFKAFSIVRDVYFVSNDFDFVLARIAGKSRVARYIVEFLAFCVVCVVAGQVHAYVDGGLLRQLRRRTFNPIELLAYRLLKIRLFVWSYGGDVRSRAMTATLGEPNCCTNCTSQLVACVCDENIAKRNLDRLRDYATAIFSMGDMAHYTPGSRNDLFYWPIDLDHDSGRRYRVAYPQAVRSGQFRIAHAPNHKEFKGTGYLEDAVRELRSEGFDLTLVLVQGVSNDEALNLYRSADMVFDQCLIGFHGYFSLEAMAIGKPVMCYIRRPQEYLLAPDECPIINTHISTIKDDIRALLQDRSILETLGRRGRSYVERHYSLDAFASRLEGVYVELGVIPWSA